MGYPMFFCSFFSTYGISSNPIENMPQCCRGCFSRQSKIIKLTTTFPFAFFIASISDPAKRARTESFIARMLLQPSFIVTFSCKTPLVTI